MLLKNAKIYMNGKFISGSMEFDEKVKTIKTDESVFIPEKSKGKIAPHKAEISDSFSSDEGKVNYDSEMVDAAGCYVIPGLIDIHTHGGAQADAGDGSSDALEILSRYYASEGVTSWCPTTATLRDELLMDAVTAAGEFVRPADGAKLAGFNLEGPFLSPKRAGAQDSSALHLPDVSFFRKIHEASNGIVRLVSVAPELPGAMEFIREVSRNATVAIGHTNADYEICLRAFENGASHITHAYNCMPGLHHREPGTIPAAIEAGATAELITDGYHVHPAIVRMTVKLFNSRLCLITDSLRCAGMPDGNYTLGELNVTKTGGRAVLTDTLTEDKPTLAGSVIHLMEGIRRAVSFGISLEDAVRAATIVPARVIGAEQEIGSLEKGKAADFVILDKELTVKAVFINGHLVRR